MWVVGLRRCLARSAEHSTNLVCRHRVLPMVKTGRPFAVSRAFGATALKMQENDAVAAAAAAETKAQSEAAEGVPHPKHHPTLVSAGEKVKEADEVVQSEKSNVTIEVETLKEEKGQKEEESIEKKTEMAEEEVQEVQKPKEKKLKGAALQAHIKAIRKAKAQEVKLALRVRHAKAVIKAQARRDKDELKLANKMKVVNQETAKRLSLAGETSPPKPPKKIPNHKFLCFLSDHMPPKETFEDPTVYGQMLSETVAKWHALTKEGRLNYDTNNHDTKLKLEGEEKAA